MIDDATIKDDDAADDSRETIVIADEDSDNGTAAVKKLRAAFQRAEGEKKDYLDGWQRAKADFINYKKDEARRLEDIAHFVSRGLMMDILPILDSFHLAAAHGATGNGSALLLIQSQLEDALKRRGLEEICVAAGAPFDPEIHESVGEVSVDFSEGSVGDIVQKGYRIQGIVLRPVRVRLAKGGSRE
ncbi:MAG: nucleotide exchange factor GrpE [Patescibacteria group bacterium]